LSTGSTILARPSTPLAFELSSTKSYPLHYHALYARETFDEYQWMKKTVKEVTRSKDYASSTST